jgi:Uma2 family endonuclease
MHTASGKKLLTTAEYMALVDQGVLHERDRVELIEGEVVEMSPIGPPHYGRVNRLNRLLIRLLGDRAVVAVQGDVRLSDITQPQPDFAILRFRDDFYSHAHAGPRDIFCLIEVADSSLSFDRRRKAPLYAKYGVAEYWIVDLVHDLLLVHREPGAEGYGSVVTLRRGDRVTLAAFPDLPIEVDELLPL